ncbi:16225_t:CDS:2, partial [Cetraspora pellucida]
GSFVMFHWVKGVPFDFNSGAYDGLTLWEQIDNGAQFTPAKKYLTAVPIGLYVGRRIKSSRKDGLGDMNAVNNEIIIVRIEPNILKYYMNKDVNSDLLDYGV